MERGSNCEGGKDMASGPARGEDNAEGAVGLGFRDLFRGSGGGVARGMK